MDPDGFAWNGETFDSLSEIAFAITGTKWNGRQRPIRAPSRQNSSSQTRRRVRNEPRTQAKGQPNTTEF
jgi:hypothetical protein